MLEAVLEQRGQVLHDIKRDLIPALLQWAAAQRQQAQQQQQGPSTPGRGQSGAAAAQQQQQQEEEEDAAGTFSRLVAEMSHNGIGLGIHGEEQGTRQQPVAVL